MKNKKVFFTFFSILCVFMLAISVHATPISFENPIKGKDSLADLIQFVYDKLMPLAMIIAAIVILIAGFRYVVAVSGGKADLAGEAKKLFVPALIGALILVGGSAILRAVVEFAKGLK